MINENFILKAHLFENGINIPEKTKKFLNSQSDIWSMDNDYITCTGITMKFGDQYITSNIRLNSNYKLVENNDELFILDEKKGNKVSTTVIFPPDYMKDEIIIGGKKITEYCNTYTDRIRIQTMCGCANHCKFCNATDCGYEFNDIECLDKAFQIALSQSNARHAFVSTNNVKNKEGFEKLTTAINYFCNKYPEMGIDVMTSPRGFTSYTDSSQYEPYLKYLKNSGVYGIATNLELNNPEKLRYFCPEKSKIGQKNYLKFLKLAVEVFGVGNVRSMLIVGLEPLKETLAGIEKLVKIGCIPVLTPLFPYGKAQGDTRAELYIEAMSKSMSICKQYGIKMGPLCRACSHNSL